MNEIEKLYENAGVEYGSCQNYSRFEQCCNSLFCDSGMCPNGISGEKHPFTTEKQIGLIKWLALRDVITIVAYINGEYHSKHDKYNANENSLEGCLARLINNLWQDLIDIEKEQIKEILK